MLGQPRPSSRLSDRRGAESAPAHPIHGHARRARREESRRKERLLSSTSYRAYLQGYYGLDERSLAMFDGRTLDLFASKSEAVSALLAWGCEYPGFQGLGLQMPKAGILERRSLHLPLPRRQRLARAALRARDDSGVAAGRGMDDIVSARFDYSRLDLPEHAVRLRLSSTVVVDLARPLVADALAAGYAAARVTRLPLPREKTLSRGSTWPSRCSLTRAATPRTCLPKESESSNPGARTSSASFVKHCCPRQRAATRPHGSHQKAGTHSRATWHDSFSINAPEIVLTEPRIAAF